MDLGGQRRICLISLSGDHFHPPQIRWSRARPGDGDGNSPGYSHMDHRGKTAELRLELSGYIQRAMDAAVVVQM